MPPLPAIAWIEAFTNAGFVPARTVTWTPEGVQRGETPRAIDVDTPPGTAALALVIDEETDGVFVVPADTADDRGARIARFTLGGADERGPVGLLARLLINGPGRKVINVLTGKLAKAAAATWERRARPEQVRWFRPRDTPATPLTPDDWSRLARGPSLLWLHGPLVQAQSGFAGFDAELWDRLADRYEGRSWAYDHHTISKSPKENAADLATLAKAAGGRLVVDVVAHSRGGLVARELAERLRDGPLEVRSLVLAGTPNLGTPLADAEHLVGYVNRFTNLLTLIPDPVSDIADAIVAVMTHVLGQAYGELPGVTAMRPSPTLPAAGDSTYLGELNALPRPTGVPYRLVGSDYRPDSALQLGKVFEGWVLDNVLHDKSNDLVVALASSLGASAGAATGTSGVDSLTVHDAPHTGYWRSPDLARRLKAWLLTAPTVGAGVVAEAPPETDDAPAAPVLVGPPAGIMHVAPEPATAGTDASDDGPALPPLVVGVRHASLEHAPYPLLVGHFAGAPLTGAEARLDERLGGRLTRLQLLGQYPRQIGESIHLLPVDDATPPGVVVIGLGPTGELTATQLTAVVTRAIVKMASHQLELRLADERLQAEAATTGLTRATLGVSSVVIGSSFGGGLTIEGAIRAILSGVTTANERLRRLRVDLGGTTTRGTEVVHLGRLELIERYADRVDLIASAIARLALLEERRREGGPPKVVFVPRPIVGEGASNANPPLDTSEEVWRRVSIAVQRTDLLPTSVDVTARPVSVSGTELSGAPGPEIAPGPHGPSQLTLRFTSMGRLARAERLASIIEPTIVQPLIDDAISRDADPDVSGTLFELLVPDLLKGELNDAENIHLLLDDTTAAYPWELLATRADDVNPEVPLALRVGVLRQFLESEELRHDIRRAAADSVLVVGNPPPGPGLHPLPAAATEATEVANLFSARVPAWSIEAMVWDANEQQVLPVDHPFDHEPGEHVLHRLLNGDWRIVHIAAHGQVTDEPSTTGVVMGGRFYLTANVFERLSVVPDLVFLNACHLGTIAPRDLRGINRVAAGVAEALLRIGTRAVIVAGWAVNDRAASAFARTLYGELLTGRHLGDAVSTARAEAKRTAPQAQTWGAYQCYGDPGFRLVALTPAARTTPAETTGELRRRIQRLAAAASDQGRGFDPDPAATKAAHDEQLTDLEARARELGSAGALADLADVHAELGQLRKSADLYREALQRGGRDVPVRAIEQVGNTLIRDAQQRFRAGAGFDEVRAGVEQARVWLAGALSLGETGERLALLGSYHKRCAAMTDGDERREHLEQAVEHYARAEQVRDDSYYWNNWVQLYQLLGLLGAEQLERWRPPPEQPTRATPVATDDRGAPPGIAAAPPAAETFWDRAWEGDQLLTAGVLSGRLDASALVGSYARAFRLRSSERERASVIDHLRDLADVLPPDQPLHASLLFAYEQLHGWKL